MNSAPPDREGTLVGVPKLRVQVWEEHLKPHGMPGDIGLFCRWWLGMVRDAPAGEIGKPSSRISSAAQSLHRPPRNRNRMLRFPPHFPQGE